MSAAVIAGHELVQLKCALCRDESRHPKTKMPGDRSPGIVIT